MNDGLVKKCPQCSSPYNKLTWALLEFINLLPEHPEDPNCSLVEIRKCYCGKALTVLKDRVT